jgi:hypothetical protein
MIEMKLRYFYKLDQKKQPILGSNIRRKSKPAGHQWKEILDPCCNPNDVDCTCGVRFFVQLDGAGKPVDHTLIKRKSFPEMDGAIRFYEIPWKSPCCLPGEVQIQGFGGADPCVGESANFYMNTDVIEIGTRLYQEDKLTPVTFNLFRDDATGLIYTIVEGLVTSVAEENCSQFFQVGSYVAFDITAITVDDVPLTYDSNTDFPISTFETGVFKTSVFVPGLRTIKVTVTGGDQIYIADSLGNIFEIPVTGAGTYTQAGVYVSGPNEDTTGVGISLL